MCFTYTHSWETCGHKEVLPIVPCTDLDDAHASRIASHVITSIDLGHPEYPCPRCVSQAVARQRTNLYFARPQQNETRKAATRQEADKAGTHPTDDRSLMRHIGIDCIVQNVQTEDTSRDKIHPQHRSPVLQPTPGVAFRTHALAEPNERLKSGGSTENITFGEVPRQALDSLQGQEHGLVQEHIQGAEQYISKGQSGISAPELLQLDSERSLD